MKNTNIIIAAVLVLICTISCTKEEPIICSCVTTIIDADGNNLSTENSAQEAPISGKCSDHYSYVEDSETGVTTFMRCN